MSLNAGSLDQSLVNVVLKGLVMSGAIDLSTFNLLVNDGAVKTLTPAELVILDGLAPTQAELNFVDGVTSSIQDQINAIDQDHATPIGVHAAIAGDHHAKYALTEDLAAGEITQLQAIGASTISAGQWAILGALVASALELNILQNYILPPMVTWGDFDGGIGSIYGNACVLLPASDSNCIGMWMFLLPTGWDTTVTLVIKYMISNTGAYSGKWDVGGFADGDNIQDEATNVLNDDTGNDFGAGTAKLLYEKTIALDDADIVGGDLLKVSFQSDASNSGILYIVAVGVKKT